MLNPIRQPVWNGEKYVDMIRPLETVIDDMGTTGHAVMKLNAEDGGRREFILVTNNENDICQKVTIPRIQKAKEVCGCAENIEIFLHGAK